MAKLCAGEWGLWRTTTMNLEKVRDYLPHLDLEEEDKTIVAQRVAELMSAMDDYPKGTTLEAARQGRRQGQVVQRDRLSGGG